MKLPIYKELLANLKLKPVSIIECQNAKNVNDGFFITRFVNYAVRPAFNSANFWRMTVRIYSSKTGGKRSSFEVLWLECICCIDTVKSRLADCGKRSASARFSVLNCGRKFALSRMCLSQDSSQMPSAQIPPSKCVGFNAPVKIRMPFCLVELHLSECAYQNTLIVVFIDTKITSPTFASVLLPSCLCPAVLQFYPSVPLSCYLLSYCPAVLQSCCFSTSRSTFINALASLSHILRTQQALNRDISNVQQNVHAIELLRDADLDANPK
jgi:hypothetical protein